MWVTNEGLRTAVQDMVTTAPRTDSTLIGTLLSSMMAAGGRLAMTPAPAYYLLSAGQLSTLVRT
jgi:hypothetical protein